MSGYREKRSRKAVLIAVILVAVIAVARGAYYYIVGCGQTATTVLAPSTTTEHG